MKRKIKAIIAAALVVCILVGIVLVALFSDGQNIQEEIKSANILAIGTTKNDISNKEYTLMLENDLVKFFMNKDTTEFKVENKVNGSVWYSSPQNRMDGSLEAATIRLSYLNAQGGLTDMDVMSGSVSEGKYKIEQSEGKVTVRYSVGDFSELVKIPYALTEERFMEIKNALQDEFQQMKLIDLYYLTDINIIEDEDLKKKRLQDYPKLSEQKLYIIRDSVKEDALAKKDVAVIFADAGYTNRDYDADSRYFKAETDAKTAPGFNISVEYTINNDCLNVNIPYNGIEMHKEFPMTSLTFAPYFGSPEHGDKGWFLLPDGSGSLMNFYNEKSHQVYRTTVYGQEKTQDGRENINNDLGAALPLYGIQNGGYGMLCEITEGDAISQIVAYSGDSTESAYAHTQFNVRSTYKQTAATGKKETFVIIQKQRYTGDIALKYHFIGSDNVGIYDMAQIARNSVFGDREANTATAIPVMLEQVGLITKRNQFLGIAYDEKVALTEFGQSLDITNAFAEKGVKNLSVMFSGWFSDGVDHTFLSKNVSASKNLGGDSGLLELIAQMKDKNIPFYLDADVQYTAKTAMFDGFDKLKNVSTMLDQSTGKLAEYDKASFIRRSNKFKYINNSESQLKAINTLVNSVSKYDLLTISLRTVGAELSADYSNPTVDRQEMANTITRRLRELKGNNFKLTTQGANAYALPYVENALNVPVSSSGFDTTDMSVPFLQMVLSGNVNYYAPTINLSGDVKTALLQAVSTGSGFSCVLTAQNHEKLAGSNQSSLYSTDYNYWKETLVPLITDYQKRLESVAGKTIVGYEVVSDGVYKTSYDNGAYVIVNMSNKDFTVDDITVSSKDFVLKEVVS